MCDAVVLGKLLLLLNFVISSRSWNQNFSFVSVNNVADHFKSQQRLLSQLEVAAAHRFPTVNTVERPFNVFVNNGKTNGNASNNSECVIDLEYTLLHLKTKWAEEMIDATGKLQSGILRGNYLWMGDIKECLTIDVDTGVNSSFHEFHGEFCVAQWSVELYNESANFPLKTAICLPDSCNGTEIQANLQAVLHYLDDVSFTKKYSSMLNLERVTCRSSREELDNLAVGFLIFIGLVALIVFSGSLITTYSYFSTQKNELVTLYSFLQSYRRSSSSSSEHEPMPNDHDIRGDEDIRVIIGGQNHVKHGINNIMSVQKLSSGILPTLKAFVLCFCIFTNGKKILSSKVTQEQLLCIHGIRVLSMTWVILGHTYVHCATVINNAVDVMGDIDNLPFQVIMQGTFSVDSFFLLSGFLLVYLFLREADKREGQIYWPYLYVHRYWRLTPVYAVIIFYVTAIFKYTGSGGFWEDVDQYKNCKVYWWWNLLYINNFLTIDSMCVAWTWYLANDMQFFFITTLVIFFIWRWPKIGLCSVGVLLALSWIMTGIISHNNNISPLFYDWSRAKNYTKYTKEILHDWDLTYSKPYCRIGPYLIGVFLAYIYYKTNKRKRFLSWWQQSIGWAVATFCSLSVIYGLYHTKIENQVVFDFYNVFSRSSFSLGVAWVIYCCLTEHAVIVNRILSLKLWIPLSRLTYCAYLIHPIIMSWYFQSLYQPLYFTHQTMVLLFFAFLLVSYVISFFVSAIFEAPFLNLEKHVREKFFPKEV